MVRQTGEPDYPRLVEIWVSAVRATHDFLSEEDFQYYKDHLTEYFGAVSLYGYESGGLLRGFVGVAGKAIEMLFVDAAERGRGVGTALVRHALENHGATEVDVNEQNKQALGFYESKGFRVVSRSGTDAAGKPYPVLHLELQP